MLPSPKQGRGVNNSLSAISSLSPPRGEAGSRTGGGSAEAPQGLGSGARPGSLEGRLSGTGWFHREWLERRRGGFVRFLRLDPVSLGLSDQKEMIVSLGSLTRRSAPERKKAANSRGAYSSRSSITTTL